MKKYLQFIGILFIILAAGYVFLVHTVMPKYIRQMLPQIEEMAPEYINGSVSIGNLTWNGGLSAEITDVTIKDNNGERVAELPRTVVHFRPWLALDNPAKAVSRIELMRPQAYLTMDDNKKWNMQHLLKPSDSKETPFYGLLEVTDANLQITMPEGHWNFIINGNINGGANPNFAADLQIVSGVDRLKLTGLVNMQGEGKLTLKGDKLDLKAYAPFAEQYAALQKLQGGLGELNVLYEKKKDKLEISGAVEIKSVQAEAEASGELHKIQLDGTVKANKNLVSLNKFAVRVDEQQVLLEGEADLNDLENIKGEGKLTAPKLAYAGYTIQNLTIPVEGDKHTLIIHDAAMEYGGGKVGFNATADLKEKGLTADAELVNVTYALNDDVKNDIHVSGQLALTAKMHEDRIAVQAATQILNLAWHDLKINQVTLDGYINDNGLNIDSFSALSDDDGSLMAKGTVVKDGALNLDGRMVEFPINPILDIATGQQGSGLCSTGFHVGGTIKAPEFSSIVQLTNVDFLNQKIEEAHGSISLKNNILEIKNFIANMQQGEHIVNGSIDLNKAEPYFNMDIETKGVRIEPLMQLVAPTAPVTGNLDNIMTFQGTISHPYVYGEVHASDGSAAKQLFNSVDGLYTYEDGKLQLKNFEVNAFLGRVILNGAMTADQQLNFELEANDVDLAHLPIKDETVDLDGKLDAKGYLQGTLTNPYFRGDVSSNEISINGEKLTELQGTLESNAREKNKFDISFKQPYKDDPINYGLYSANLNINLTQRFIQGKMAMVWGDIGGLLRIARQDYDINGLMQGEMTFNPQGKGSGIHIAIDADNVKIHDLNYAHMNFKGSMRKGVLYFDDVKLQEQAEVTDSGIIAVGGNIDLLGKKMNVEVASAKANPAIVTAVMTDPPEIKGEMDMLAQLTGTFDNPEGNASLLINNASVAGVGMDSVTAMLFLKDDNIKLQQLMASKDAYSLKASGDIPLDIFRSKEDRRNSNAQMNIVLDLDEARLGILPTMTPLVEWGVGDTKGKIRIAGTLEEPLLFGSIKIADGAVKVKYLDTVLENINLDVAFQGNEVLLRNLSTKMGKGTVAAEGSYALHTGADTAYKLHVTAKDAEVASAIVNGRVNSDIAIVPQKYLDYKNYNKGQEPTEHYRPAIKGNVRLDDVTINMPTIPPMGEGESNIGLDLVVELGPKIHLYNSYLYDIWLSGGMHLKGSTMYPIIDGKIKADKGTIKYLRTDFKLNKASLVWVDPGSFLPNVNLESTARFSRYNIMMKINGPVSEMDLQLTSNPPLEKNTIIRMLTLQRESAGSNEVTSEDMNNLMAAGLQMTVLGDVEMWVKQTLGLDQFRIYTGKVRSGVGFESTKDRNQELTEDEKNQYNVLISKYLTNNFMIGYTTSFNGIDRSIFGQYDISRHLSLTYSRSYDLSDKAEDWYGLEYKLSF